jgi:long-chain fatty acid transport protein
VKSMQRPIRTIVSAVITAIMGSSIANAGSFSLYTESSPAAMGNFGAGIAAEAADASTAWYNPAGLVLLCREQVQGGVVGVFPTARITGKSTFATQGIPSYEQRFRDLPGAKTGYVPSFYYAKPLGSNSAFGLSLNAPFGLSTQWNRTGPVRYAATTSNLIVFNLAPEIAGRINECFSVGGGIDLQYAHVRFHSVLGAPALLQAFGLQPTLLDSLSYNRGSSFGLGFHAGALAMFNNNHTRIGFNYQSQVRHRFTGLSRLHGGLASLSPNLTPEAILMADLDATFFSRNLSSNIIAFPEIATLSGYQDINERLALLGSIVYTWWNSLKTIELDQVAAYAPAPAAGQVFVNSITLENYRNVWRFAVGANYRVNPCLLLRVGGGYDQTPTRVPFRDIRVPDRDRWAASIGAHYQVKPNIGVDVGYTRLFLIGDNRINKTIFAGSQSTYNVKARIRGYANLFGLQATWYCDQPMVCPTK